MIDTKSIKQFFIKINKKYHPRYEDKIYSEQRKYSNGMIENDYTKLV